MTRNGLYRRMASGPYRFTADVRVRLWNSKRIFRYHFTAFQRTPREILKCINLLKSSPGGEVPVPCLWTVAWGECMFGINNKSKILENTGKLLNFMAVDLTARVRFIIDTMATVRKPGMQFDNNITLHLYCNSKKKKNKITDPYNQRRAREFFNEGQG